MSDAVSSRLHSFGLSIRSAQEPIDELHRQLIRFGRMDDVYAINVAKSQFRDGFNTGDPDLVLSVFAPTFTDMSDGRPSRYREDARLKLSAYLSDLFAHFTTRRSMSSSSPSGSTATPRSITVGTN